MVQTVEFRVAPLSAPKTVMAVTPWIDGVSLVDLVARYEREKGFDVPGAYGGIVPAYFRFGPLVDHYFGRGSARPGVQLLGCDDCGEAGCWPLRAQVTIDRGRVRWCDFMQPFRKTRDYSGFGPFEFDEASYLGACQAASRNVPDAAT